MSPLLRFTLSEAQRERLSPHGALHSIAQECHEFVDCIREGRRPEVGPQEGYDSLAVAAAVYESAVSGQAVRVADVASGRIDAFQRPIDAYWQLV
jgi:predicted dehydrogenase